MTASKHPRAARGAVVVFALIVFHLAVGWKTYRGASRRVTVTLHNL